MTPQEFTQSLPRLTTDPLPIEPPFAFNGLSSRVFPLRANLDALQQLVNGYLNIVPPEVGRFRVSVPYVYLSILDYGQISEAILGWFAQVEVFFCVPVEWYKVKNGQWVFHDWAVITPFIYVDDDFSVPMGRMVYGFPKALAHVRSVKNHWISDVRSPVTLAQLETAVFPELYHGEKLQTRTFLEIERAPPMANFGLPPDAASPAAPWVMASHVADAIGGLGRDAIWMSQAMRIFGVNPATNPDIPPEMLNRIMPSLDPSGPGLVMNSLNLKQFRRSAEPMEIAYQALTNGPMQMMGFSRGGLLNEERILLGDSSGGHRIKIHEYTSLPIVRKLGLEVARRWRGDGVDVAELAPVMPFWIEVNVRYTEGRNLAWRTGDADWRDGTGAPVASRPGTTAKDRKKPHFNTTLASAVEAITGPFQYSGTTIRVLPLLANAAKMQAYIDAYINHALSNEGETDADGAGLRLSVWHRPPAKVNLGAPIGGTTGYVYMTASSFEAVTSLTNNAGDWANYELSFMIPVKLERRQPDGRWSVEGVGVVPTFNFVDSSIAAIARLEVEGISTLRAEFIRPDVDWLNDGQSPIGEEQTLLQLQGEVIHAIGEDQKTALEPILEIFRVKGHDPGLTTNSLEAQSQWANYLRREQGTMKGTRARYPDDSKIARALGLEILGNRTPIALYSLKQIRDVADPARACYQSLERQSRSFQDVFDIREIEQNIIVRFRDFPTLKLVDALGIVGHQTHGEGAGIIHTTHAVRPFYVRATVNESFSEPLATRAGTRHWTVAEDAFNTRLSTNPGPTAPKIVANRLAETLQDAGDPCRMHNLMRQVARAGRTMGERHPSQPPAGATAGADRELVQPEAIPAPAPDDLLNRPITADEARAAVEKIDPQMLIDTMLSREWGNNNPDARWRQGRKELVESYGDLLAGSTYKRAANAEWALYEMANNRMATRTGSAQKTTAEVSAGLVPLHKATFWRKQLEKHFAVLSAWAIFRMDGRLTDYSGESKDGFRVMLEVPPYGPDVEKAEEAPDLRPGNLCRALCKLLVAVSNILLLDIHGEPSPGHNLSTKILADQFRLDELVNGPLKSLAEGFGVAVEPDDAPWNTTAELDETYEGRPQDPLTQSMMKAKLEEAWLQIEAIREAVELARGKCQIQRDALLNKLSRAYQKPDFCIFRDPFGEERDELVPASLSWDKHWYYGKSIEPDDVGGVANKSTNPAPNDIPGKHQGGDPS